MPNNPIRHCSSCLSDLGDLEDQQHVALMGVLETGRSEEPISRRKTLQYSTQVFANRAQTPASELGLWRTAPWTTGAVSMASTENCGGFAIGTPSAEAATATVQRLLQCWFSLGEGQVHTVAGGPEGMMSVCALAGSNGSSGCPS